MLRLLRDVGGRAHNHDRRAHDDHHGPAHDDNDATSSHHDDHRAGDRRCRAKLFVDPQGFYEMLVDPTWVESHGTLVAEIEFWVVAEPEAGFASNVNVLTQVAGVPDMESYVNLSVESAPLFIENFGLVRTDIFRGPLEQELGVMEYTGTSAGFDLHFLGVFILEDELAVVATFTSLADRYDELVDSVEPYLLTLRAAE